jgi:hypothetical protein
MPLATMGVVASAITNPPGPYLYPANGAVWTNSPPPPPSGGYVLLFKTRGPTKANTSDRVIAGQYDVSGQYSWMIARRSWSTNQLVAQTSADGSSGTAVQRGDSNTPLPIPLADECFAAAYFPATSQVATWKSTDNGATWTLFSTSASSTAVTPFQTSTDPLRIGMVYGNTAYYPFDGRIYWVEMRDGTDPNAGARQWRFDASEYPGSGTSYVDPRGRTWNIDRPEAIKIPGSETYETQLLAPGSGQYAQTPDAVALQVTGDIDVSWFGALWNTSASCVINKYSNTSNQRSWMMRLTIQQRLTGIWALNIEFFCSTDGIASSSYTTTYAPDGLIRPGQMFGARVTRRQSDGSTKIYYSMTDPPSWTLAGTQTLLSGSALFNCNAPIIIGGHTLGTQSPLQGVTRRAEVRNGFDGAGSLIATPNFTGVNDTLGVGLIYTDAQSNPWSMVSASSDLQRNVKAYNVT